MIWFLLWFVPFVVSMGLLKYGNYLHNCGYKNSNYTLRTDFNGSILSSIIPIFNYMIIIFAFVLLIGAEKKDSSKKDSKINEWWVG